MDALIVTGDHRRSNFTTGSCGQHTGAEWKFAVVCPGWRKVSHTLDALMLAKLALIFVAPFVVRGRLCGQFRLATTSKG